MKKQWASYFQKLLYEQKFKNAEEKRMDMLNNQLEDLKAAIISSINDVDQKEIARSVVRFRMLSDFLFSLKLEVTSIISSHDDFNTLLKSKGIIKTIDSRVLEVDRNNRILGRTLLVREDGTYYDCRMSIESVKDLERDWNDFKALQEKSKKIKTILILVK